MTTRYTYNRQASPPAPFIHVVIAQPDAEDMAITKVPAQIDTAADISVIPTDIVKRLQLVPCDRMRIAGIGGHVSLEPIYLAVLKIHQFAALTLPILSVKDEPYVLLGRDVLNQFRLILDGPRLLLDIE